MSISMVFLKNFVFPLCTDIFSHLGKRACMYSSAKIFCMFRIFVYCRCLEIICIVVYEYFLTPLPHVGTVFVGHMHLNYPLIEC